MFVFLRWIWLLGNWIEVDKPWFQLTDEMKNFYIFTESFWKRKEQNIWIKSMRGIFTTKNGLLFTLWMLANKNSMLLSMCCRWMVNVLNYLIVPSWRKTSLINLGHHHRNCLLDSFKRILTMSWTYEKKTDMQSKINWNIIKNLLWIIDFEQMIKFKVQL